MNEKNAVTVRQVSVLIFITAVASKLFMLPSMLTAEIGRNGYLGMLLYLGVDFCVLVAVVVAVKRTQCDFYTLLSRTLGAVGARILLGISIVFLVFKVTLMAGELRIFFSENIFDNFGWALFAIPLLAFLCWSAAKSLRCIGRTSEIVVPFILLGFILLVILTATKVDYVNLLPIAKDGGGDLWKFTAWLGDYSVLALLAGKVQAGKAPATRWLLAGAAGAIAVETFTVMICAAYGNLGHLLELGHNLGAMAQHSGTQNFGRLDLFIFTIFLSSVVIKLMVYMYAAARHTAFVTTVDKPLLWAGVAAAAVYVLSVFVLPSPGKLYGLAQSWIRYIALVEQFAVPLVTFIGSLIPFCRAPETQAPQPENDAPQVEDTAQESVGKKEKADA